MEQARHTRLVVCVLFGSIFCPGIRILRAQECPSSLSCNAVVGSLVIPNSSSDAANRVVRAEQESPDGLFTDEILSLSYNRSWNDTTGVTRDDITQPMTSLGLESYWSGSTELNIDMSAPNSTTQLRPLGLMAKYDGSIAELSIGGGSYAQGAGGVTLLGGTQTQSTAIIEDRVGSETSDNLLEMMRQDGTDSFTWRAGGTPSLNFALDARNANGFGNYGVLKFVGEWDYDEPLMEFESLGTGAILINSLPASTDTNSRFLLTASGNINWGSGASPVDTDLYRSAASTLRTDGSLVVGGNLMVMGSKAALVHTASYGQREVYAVESPGEWFEDFGTGRLVHGRMVVRIDPIFGETITTDRDYHVFLTPNGRCSLYVARKSLNEFTVESLRGSMECLFDYRIVAKRKGYEKVRLVEIRNEK
jgi:hypothetical protein